MGKTVRIGQACSDETGKYVGGKAGDQTGKEVRVNDWDNQKWENVFRAKKKVLRTNIADNVKKICQNDKIGYSQSDRYSAYMDYLKGGKTLEEISGNTDCSQTVNLALLAAGITAYRYMSTWDMEQRMEETGAFKTIPYEEGMTLLKGDILQRKGHTATVVEITSHAQDEKYTMECIKETNVYTKPTKYSPKLPSCPKLGVGNEVGFCDVHKKYIYVKIGDYHGYVFGARLKKV